MPILKQKIIKYLAIAIPIAIIIVFIYRQQTKVEQLYILPDNYFANSQITFNQMIDTEYPQYSIQKDLPYFADNEYFEYSIFPSGQSISKIDVYLTPKNPTDLNLDTQYAETKNEILNWIVTKGTLISDIQIDWYASLPETNQKTLIEQTNA